MSKLHDVKATDIESGISLRFIQSWQVEAPMPDYIEVDVSPRLAAILERLYSERIAPAEE